MIRKALTRIYMSIWPAALAITFAATGQPHWLVAVMVVVALPSAVLLFLPEE